MTTEERPYLLCTTPETVRYWRHVRRGPALFNVGRRVVYAHEDVNNVIETARLRGKAESTERWSPPWSQTSRW